MKRSVTISVYDKMGNVLTVSNRRWGGFTIPGGKVESGEDPELAAWRELKEETGLVPAALRYLGSSLFDNPFTTNSPWLVSHYEAVIKNPQPRQVEEGTVPVWRRPLDVFFAQESIFREHIKQISPLGVVRPYGV